MIYNTRVPNKAGLPLFLFFTAVQRHHLPRKVLIYFASQNWTVHKWFSLSYLTLSLSVSTTKRGGGWLREPLYCIALSILQTASFNCFLSMATKKKHKKINNSSVRQKNVNAKFLKLNKEITCTALAWTNSRHFGIGFPAKYRLWNDCSNPILMTDLVVLLIGWSKFTSRFDQSESLPRSG